MACFFDCCSADSTLETNVKTNPTPIGLERTIDESSPPPLALVSTHSSTKVEKGERDDSETKKGNPSDDDTVDTYTASDNLDPAEEVEAATALYSMVEERDWNNVLVYLSDEEEKYKYSEVDGITSKGETSGLSDTNKWVVEKDWWGNIQYRMLPIHCAIVRNAPLEVIQKLLEFSPSSAKAADHEGNLPAHLVFKHNASEKVISFVINFNRDSISVKNKDNNVPAQCSSSNAGEIIQIYVEQINEASQREEARLNELLGSENNRLSEMLNQIAEVKSELLDVKKLKEEEKLDGKQSLSKNLHNLKINNSKWTEQQKKDIETVDGEVERMKKEYLQKENTELVVEKEPMETKQSDDSKNSNHGLGPKSRKLKRLFKKKRIHPSRNRMSSQ